MAFIRLQNLIPQAAGKYGIATEVQAARVCHILRTLALEMMGPDASERIAGVTFKNDTLLVSCSSSSAAQSLQLQKHLIIERIQKDAPDVKIKDLRIR